jgi:CTP:molybdopterin cytidylyltransferase MocA
VSAPRGDKPRVAVVVLAAGAGSRFGGHKLEADLDGRPVLQHVLDTLAEAGHDDPFVVVPPDPGFASRLEWRRARQVVNPEPARGLSSSLRIGWAGAMGTGTAPDAIFVVLGDQPRLRREVVANLASVPLDPTRPIVAAGFAGSSARNPVRIEVTAAHLIDRTSGDRGLGPILDANPELVRWLDVEGDNPDVDVPEDLARLREDPSNRPG